MWQARPPCMAQLVPTRELQQEPGASTVSGSGSWNHDKNKMRGHTGPSVSSLRKHPAYQSSAHPYTPAVTRACCHGGEIYWEEGLLRELQGFRAHSIRGQCHLREGFLDDLPECEISEESGILIWEEMGELSCLLFSLFANNGVEVG